VKLSARDRAKTNAALAMVHDAGHNPDAITSVARDSMNIGTPIKLAYERAFNGFVKQVPAFHGKLQRLGQLIDAADDQTLAAYNIALRHYIETGDSAALDPVQATFAKGMADMAAQTGDAGFADLVAMPPPAPTAPAASTPTEAARTGPGWSATGYRPSDNQAVVPAT
jgi:hypothetical protein